VRGGAAITLVYLRPDGCSHELEDRLREVARRFGAAVEIVVRPWCEAGRLARWAAPGSAAILVLRRGVVVGEALGDGLPSRELDRVIRRAVESRAS
jgi:hypothetical protein